MLDSIKRWFGAPAVNVPGWGELCAWARQRQWALRAVREPDGFVVDGRAGDAPWRLEWGPSQRSYVAGAELRLDGGRHRQRVAMRVHDADVRGAVFGLLRRRRVGANPAQRVASVHMRHALLGLHQTGALPKVGWR